MINNKIFRMLLSYSELKQIELARKTGISFRSVSGYTKKTPISGKKLDEIAKTLGLQIVSDLKDNCLNIYITDV